MTESMRTYTVDELADLLHMCRETVYRHLSTGRLRSLKVGRLRRVTEAQLTEFLESMETTGV